MKLLRFGPAGHEKKPGVLDANGVIRDLSGVIDDISGEVLHPGSLARLRDVCPETLPTAPLAPALARAWGASARSSASALTTATTPKNRIWRSRKSRSSL